MRSCPVPRLATVDNLDQHCIGDITPDYTGLLALADDAPALLADINLVLGLPTNWPRPRFPRWRWPCKNMPFGNDARRRNRVHAALVMVLAAGDDLTTALATITLAIGGFPAVIAWRTNSSWWPA